MRDWWLGIKTKAWLWYAATFMPIDEEDDKDG